MMGRSSIKTKIRNGLKEASKSLLFPLLFRVYCLRYPKVDSKKIVFADAHHESLPEEMKPLYKMLKQRGYPVITLIHDFKTISFFESLREISRFLRHYATAETVILCDYYLPAISVKKRKATRVVQLWHACGAFKKFGYDAEDDLGWMKNQNMFKNFDLVAVSSKACEKIYAGAFHIPRERVKALGVARTDRYFQEDFIETCKTQFYEQYPEAKGKRILLWAPTFRKSATEAGVIGLSEILWLKEQLSKEWIVLIKLHPHSEKQKKISNCEIKTEQLYPVIDLLVTDYSSVIFDFALTGKPMLFYLPDLSQYQNERGFYLSLDELPGKQIQKKEELLRCIKAQYYQIGEQRYQAFVRKYLEQCDGHATERILQEIL